MARYNSYGEFDSQFVDDLDSQFIGFNNRSRPDSLNPGILQESNNFRFKREGIAQVRDSIVVKSAPLTLDDNTAFTIPFYVYGLPDDSTSTSTNISTTSIGTSGTVLTLNMDPAENFFVDDTLVFVGAISGLTDYSSGNYLITERAAGYIKIDVPGISGTATGNTTIGAPRVEDSFVTRVYGSALFEDPTNEGEPYIIIAGNTKAIAVRLSDQTTTDITYDSGAVQLGADVDIIQAFNRVYIFRKGLTALEWNGVLTGSPNFTKVPSGTYTQPVLLGSTNNTTVTNGKIEVSETGHGLLEGETVVIVDAGHTELVIGDTYRVTVVDDDNFYFYADIDDQSAHTNKFIKRVSRGGGYIHMPGAEYGVFHQDRLVVPFTHSSASTPVARGIIDEILFSELEQPDTYDPEFGRSRMYQGGDDKVMGLFSFTEDKLIVFMRNSIFLFSNTVDLRSATKTLLTHDIGLVARNSVVQVGANLLFLSDNGVYGLTFQDLYNLRGRDKPLSEPIQKTIDNINKDNWHKSVGVYFDNKYYLAVPLDYDQQSSDKNNAIIIYNFLNGQWESVDTVFGTSSSGQTINWDIQNLIVAGDGDNRGVYAVNSLGGIHQIDASESNNDDLLITQIGGTQQSVPIEANLKSRQFNFKDLQRKKWNTFELQLQSNEVLSSDGNIEFNTENIDDKIQVGTFSDFLPSGAAIIPNEDVSIRGRIGNRRAYGCDCNIIVTQGKPKVKLIKVSGGLSFNSTQSIE